MSHGQSDSVAALDVLWTERQMSCGQNDSGSQRPVDRATVLSVLPTQAALIPGYASNVQGIFYILFCVLTNCLIF